LAVHSFGFAYAVGIKASKGLFSCIYWNGGCGADAKELLDERMNEG